MSNAKGRNRRVYLGARDLLTFWQTERFSHGFREGSKVLRRCFEGGRMVVILEATCRLHGALDQAGRPVGVEADRPTTASLDTVELSLLEAARGPLPRGAARPHSPPLLRRPQRPAGARDRLAWGASTYPLKMGQFLAVEARIRVQVEPC